MFTSDSAQLDNDALGRLEVSKAVFFRGLQLLERGKWFIGAIQIHERQGTMGNGTDLMILHLNPSTKKYLFSQNIC